VKVKTSKLLNKLSKELFNYGVAGELGLEDVLIKADFYCNLDRTPGDQSVYAGIKMCEKSTKSNLPIYEVEFHNNEVLGYFVKDINSIKKLFDNEIKKCKKSL
jgi:hypothetical protein